MNAGVRSRLRRGWPRGLREPRPGYFTWDPPTDILPYLDNPPPKGGYVLGRMTLQEAIAQVTEAYLSVHGKMTAKRYRWLAAAVDCTNGRESTSVAVYCPDDCENTIFVRDADEFFEKFDEETVAV